jgi:C4-dicarboxylate-specific signal transduction histidine kinase
MKIEKKFFILLLLLGVIPLLLVIVLFYYEAKKTVEEEVFNKLELFASYKVEKIEDIFARYEKKVQVIAQREFLLKNAKALIENFKKDEKKYKEYVKKLDIVAISYINLNQFYDFFIISPNGDIVYTALKESDFGSNIHTSYIQNTPLHTSFKNTLKTKQITVSDFRYYQPSNKGACFITAPILENNKLIAILAFQVDIDMLYNVILKNYGLSRSLESIVADKEGDSILILSPLKFEKDTAFKKKISITDKKAKYLKLALEKHNGYGVHVDYRGEKVLIVWKYVPKLNIALIVKEDEAEALVGLHKMLYVMGGVFIVASLFIWYVFLQTMRLVRKLNEQKEQYEDSKKFFELILDAYPYIVVIKDKNSKVLYANKQAKDFVSTTMVGKTPYENVGKEIGEKIIALSNRAIKEKKAEMLIRYEKNNQEYYFHALSFRIDKDDEYLIGSIYHDVTQHEKTKKELKEKDELMIIQSRYAAMGEMIGMIAHQWRQPLAVVAMDVNNMLLDIELETFQLQEFQKNLYGILEQTKYLSNTIDDFRNFFKKDKEKTQVHLVDILEKSLTIVAKSLENNGITYHIDNRIENSVFVYERELLQVFLNLFANAKDALVQHKEDDRKIFVKLYEDTENVFIQMCDNGGGIDEEIITKIFEPYFSTKQEKHGTGLGLYMSKIIVEKHLGGTLKVYNSDTGACFIITLGKNK